MALTETWTPSRRMQSAAAAEQERIERDAARLAAREDELNAELAHVRAAREELEDQWNVLKHFLRGQTAKTPGREDRQLRVVTEAEPELDGMTVLRGARIRETAVRVLAAKVGPDTPVHYRDWFELLTAEGFKPAGKDPLAVFLTQVGRSPVVQRTTKSGVYVLDLEFPERMRCRLEQLRTDLEALPQTRGQTVAEIAEARKARDALVAETQEAERQLDEALRSLGDSPVGMRPVEQSAT